MIHVNRRREELFLNAERDEEEGRLEEAYTNLLMAARLGHSWSQVNLGNFYSAGKGVAVNVREAEKWYRRAASNGDSSGAYNLALDLQARGKRRSAMRWFLKAANMGHGEAYIALAKLYRFRSRKMQLLQHALTLSSDEITQDGREEAKTLLRQLENSMADGIN